MFALALVGVLMVSAAEPAPVAYPIRPQSLRRLVIDSDVVAVVRMRSSEALTDEAIGPELVVLDIEEVLVGDPAGSTLELVNHTAPLCPMPAHYGEDTRLVFLRVPSKGDEAYWSTGLSYGAKSLDDEALAHYVDQIRALQSVQGQPRGPERFYATCEWLIGCLQDPVTREEAVIDLLEGDREGDRYPSSAQPDWYALMTEDQRRRVVDVFSSSVEINRADWKFLMFLDQVAIADECVVPWVLAKLERVVLTGLMPASWEGSPAADPTLSWYLATVVRSRFLRQAMQSLDGRLGDERLAALIAAYRELKGAEVHGASAQAMLTCIVLRAGQVAD